MSVMVNEMIWGSSVDGSVYTRGAAVLVWQIWSVAEGAQDSFRKKALIH